MSKASPLAYLRQVKVELDQVRWPNHRDTLRLTIVVVVGSVAVGAYVGGMDILFINLLQRLIGY